VITALGYAGTFFLCVGGIPQVYRTYKLKTVHETSILNFIVRFLGLGLTLLYIVLTSPTAPLVIGYILNSITNGVSIWQWFKYRHVD